MSIDEKHLVRKVTLALQRHSTKRIGGGEYTGASPPRCCVGVSVRVRAESVVSVLCKLWMIHVCL